MKCKICNNEITSSYIKNEWGEVIHSFHDRILCSCCNRFVCKGGMSLNDGRFLCSDCVSTVVKDEKHIELVKKKVLEIFKINGLNDISENIPIKIVSVDYMAHLTGSGMKSTNQLGFTMTKGYYSLYGKKLSHEIFMLDWQERTMFAGTLAHEYLHVWQNEKCIKLESSLCEGFCNLGSFIIYKAINSKLSHFLFEQMKKNPDPVYGDGFRKVKEIYDTKAGRNIIDTVKFLIN